MDLNNGITLQFGKGLSYLERTSTTYNFPMSYNKIPTVLISVNTNTYYETPYNEIASVSITSFVQTWTLPCFWISVGY